MKKIAKGLSAVLLAATLTIGMAITACAGHDQNSYSTFDWSYTGCTIKNTTNISRYMTASMEVYIKNTGDFVNSSFCSGTGAYGTTVSTSNPEKDSEDYNYIWRGAIYNGAHANAGIADSYSKP